MKADSKGKICDTERATKIAECDDGYQFDFLYKDNKHKFYFLLSKYIDIKKKYPEPIHLIEFKTEDEARLWLLQHGLFNEYVVEFGFPEFEIGIRG